MEFDYEAEFASLTAQTRALLYERQVSDPDDFRAQSNIAHALELCHYRLKRFACQKSLTDGDLTHLILIETVFPEIKCRIPVEYQRHTNCPCASQMERKLAEQKAAAFAALVPPSIVADRLADEFPLEHPPFEERRELTDADMGLRFDLEHGIHLPAPIDPILPDGDYDLDEVGDSIIHYDYGQGVNSSIDEFAIDSISAEVISDHHGKSFVDSKTQGKTATRRRFRGRVDAISKVLTIVRRGGVKFATLSMKPYGLAPASPEVLNLPMVGIIELREIFKIVKWWTSKYYTPLSASDLAERAFSSMPKPSILEFCKLMV